MTQTASLLSGTEREIFTQLETLLTPTDDGCFKRIDALQVVSSDTYAKVHSCFVVWHLETPQENKQKEKKEK